MSLTGKLINNTYRINGKLSEGWMSDIYLGHAVVGDNVPVIINMLKQKGISQRRGDIIRFTAEAAAVSRLFHSNIARILEIGQFDSVMDVDAVLAEYSHYLVTEHYEGKYLAELISDRICFPVLMILQIIIQLAGALDFIHANGIIHRDLRPGNIIIPGTYEWQGASSFVLKIDGFGLAHVKDFACTHNQEHAQDVFGYMAPEQTGMMKIGVDRRSDLYSLGIIFYQLLTGRLPFIGDDPGSIIYQHMACSPQRPGIYNNDIPNFLDRIVMKLLEKDPANRYQSAESLLYDLELFRSGKPAEIVGAVKAGSLSLRAPLVGRERELSRLQYMFDRASIGKGCMVLVSGEAGIGKSRLVEELQGYAIVHGGIFIGGKCIAGDVNAHYGPFRDAMSMLINHLNSFPVERKNELLARVRAAIGNFSEIIIRFNPVLAEIVGPGLPMVELEPDRENRRFLSVLCSFIQALGVLSGPLVLVIDDLQWLDEGSITLLSELMRQIATLPILVIGTCRDDETSEAPPLKKLRDAASEHSCPIDEIKIDSLDQRHIFQFIFNLLGISDSVVEEIATFVFAKSRGNPFFTLELTKQMVYDEVIRQRGAGWEFDRASRTLTKIPSNIVDIILRRIELLEEGDVRVLSCAAVVGKNFDIELLVQLCAQEVGYELTPEAVIRAVDRAISMQLLEENPREKGRVLFAHDRIQEALCRNISHEAMMDYHRSIARLIEESDHDPDRYIFDLAHHYIKTGDREKIVFYCLPAGKRAMQNYANEEAIRYLSRARGLLEENGLSGGDDWFACMNMLGEIYLRLGNNDAAIEIFNRLLPLLADTYEISRTAWQMSSAFFKKGDMLNCEKYGRQSLAILGENLPLGRWRLVAAIAREFLVHLLHILLPRFFVKRKDNPAAKKYRLMVHIYHTLSWSYFLANISKAFFSIVRMLNISERHIGPSIELGLSTMAYADLCMAIPLFDRAMAYHRRALLIRKHLRDRLGIAQSLQFIGFLYQWKGDVVRSNRIAMRARTRFREIGDRWELGMIENTCSANHVYISRYAESISHAQEWLAISSQLGDGFGMSVSSANLLWAFTEKGDFVQAAEWGEKAVSLAIEHHSLFAQCLAFTYLGHLHGEMKNYSHALDCLDKAVALDEQYAFMKNYSSVAYPYRAEVLINHYEAQMAGFGPVQRSNHLRAIRSACAIARSQTRRWPLLYCMALAVTARYYALTGKNSKAERFFQRTISQARRHNRLFIMAKGLYEYGRFLLKAGRTEDARLRLESACRAFEEIHARVYAERANALINNSEGQRSPIERMVDREKISLIIQMGQDISSILNLNDLLNNMLRKAVEVTGAQRGYLFIKNNESGLLELKNKISMLSEEADQFSMGIVEDVFIKGEPLIAHDAEKEERFASYQSVRMFRLRSILCVPIRHQRNFMGICYLDNRLAAGVFSEEDVEVLSVFMTQAAISIDNANLYANLEQMVVDRTATIDRQKRELEEQIIHAQKIQVGLLPADVPRTPDIAIAYKYVPMMGLGGDFIDICHDHNRKGIGLFICDGSGHGVPAAFLASMVKMSMNAWIDYAEDPATTLRHLYYSLQGKMGGNFITACACYIDIENKIMRYANAGHPPIIILRSNGDVVFINAKGYMIYDLMKPNYESAVCTLQKGDIVILYTDGIVEARNPGGAILGEEHFVYLIKKFAGLPPDQMCERIFNSVLTFTAKSEHLEDDLSILIAKIL